MFITVIAKVLALVILLVVQVEVNAADYGVDCSFPIHSRNLKCGNLLGNRSTFYEHFMSGCREFYGNRGNRCDITEQDRIDMSIRQVSLYVVLFAKKIVLSSFLSLHMSHADDFTISHLKI